VIVSTENKEIAEVSSVLGAEVLERPPELASDTATTREVLKHAVETLSLDCLCVLQPTSPIRINSLIDRAVARFFESGADTLATGYMCKDYEWTTVPNVGRQHLNGWFYDDGNVYVHKAFYIREGRYWGDKLERMVVDSIYNHEIDDIYQAVMIEALMEHLGMGS
jgi:N-acylneuraminate cytidylyltransferase